MASKRNGARAARATSAADAPLLAAIAGRLARAVMQDMRAAKSAPK